MLTRIDTRGWTQASLALEILPGWATWRSGDAADCKSVYPGSIPGVASNFLTRYSKDFLAGVDEGLAWRLPLTIRKQYLRGTLASLL
jgi:hypothetical protein